MSKQGIINAGGTTWRQVRLGDFTVTTILDGTMRREGPSPTFGTDQEAETVATLLAENHLPADHFLHCFVPTLIQTPGDLVLFDTGFGPMGRDFGCGQLRARMQEAGYGPEDVSVVVLTHMHGDHIGGLLEEDGPAFPNARYVASEVEFEFWTSDKRQGTPQEDQAKSVHKNVVPLAEKFSFIGDGAQVVPGMTAIAAHGHSPGHMVFLIESDNRQLMLTADTANHYVASLQRPDWHVAFDFDKKAAAATRKAIFGRIADAGMPFIGHHMPFPSIGYVERMGDGFRYVPASYQFDI